MRQFNQQKSTKVKLIFIQLLIDGKIFQATKTKHNQNINNNNNKLRQKQRLKTNKTTMKKNNKPQNNQNNKTKRKKQTSYLSMQRKSLEGNSLISKLSKADSKPKNYKRKLSILTLWRILSHLPHNKMTPIMTNKIQYKTIINNRKKYSKLRPKKYNKRNLSKKVKNNNKNNNCRLYSKR